MYITFGKEFINKTFSSAPAVRAITYQSKNSYWK